MATLNAKKSATKVEKPSVTLGNRSLAYRLMYAAGESSGRAAQAKLEAVTKFQADVASGKIDVSTKELRDAAILDAATGYDDGQASVPGNKPLSKGSFDGLKTEFGSFIRAEVITHHSKGYALIVEALKSSADKPKVPDAYQQRLEVNRAISAASGAATLEAVKARLFKTKTETEKPLKERRAAAIAKLIKECDAIIAAKLGLSKELRDEIATFVATLKA